MSNDHYDVIIIGAGFAGVTVAREVSQQGFRPLILEGRDRIGGRTWVAHRLGSELELGGSWVHWFQPHVWSEISRYGLKVTASPKAEKVYWMTAGIKYEGTFDEWYEKMDEGMKRLLNDTRKYFPYPYNPLREFKQLKEIDHMSVEEKLKELGLQKEAFDLVYSLWALHFNSTLEEAGLTQAYRLAAMAGHNWKLILETASVYKLSDGTKTLIESILKDAKGAKLRLSTIVSKVEKTSTGYKVGTVEGNEFTSASVIVALPLNTLNNIEFKPELSEKKRHAAAEKQASKGFKFWARVRGITTPFILMAPADHKINYAQVEELHDRGGLIVGFGCDSTKLDLENQVEVAKELRKFIPDIEVLECTGHDWMADRFSLGTWAMLKKKQLTEYLLELQKEESGLFIAGSDYANGWAGFIDGAIESGITTGIKVAKYLLKNRNSNS
ncbi:flavin monoamine oxidase family protein [Bacillus sp. JJ1562]|uniref:flavin monoamine oxidase family protein n=1 Tax=Bacillus sp. JJ1562 TaxID=3122960 RepID=UPI003001A731